MRVAVCRRYEGCVRVAVCTRTMCAVKPSPSLRA